MFLVDDEKTVCDLICRIVTTAGAHCDSFTNGADAVAAFRAGRYDLAILDLTLPGMSGREIFEHIRARDPVLRTLIISGYSANDTVANWGEATPHGFLQKPFSATVLRRTIDAAILRELA